MPSHFFVEIQKRWAAMEFVVMGRIKCHPCRACNGDWQSGMFCGDFEVKRERIKSRSREKKDGKVVFETARWSPILLSGSNEDRYYRTQLPKFDDLVSRDYRGSIFKTLVNVYSGPCFWLRDGLCILADVFCNNCDQIHGLKCEVVREGLKRLEGMVCILREKISCGVWTEIDNYAVRQACRTLSYGEDGVLQ